jgi:methionyl-tRNA formyltransferase
MRVIFMGTPDYAVPSLSTLIQDGYEIVAVVTQPDRPKGRKQELTPPPVKVEALRHGLTVLQPEKLRTSDCLDELERLQPDVLVTAAYGQILPKRLLELPRFGCINVHASLLPKYRGGAPIQRCLMDGERETGVTIMEMVQALDAGGIYSQVIVPIEWEDNVGSLHDKLALAGARLLHETLPDILAGKLKPVPQDESKVTYAPNITREDERIDWSKTSVQIYNQIRALDPWPGAFTYLNEKVLKVWKAVPHEDRDTGRTPGTILRADDQGIEVATGSGSIMLLTIQPAGKGKMEAEAFVRGRGVEAGILLGEEPGKSS